MITTYLHYGQRAVPFDFDHNQFDLLKPQPLKSPLSGDEITAAFEKPIGSPPLSQLVASAKNVLIIISDATRVARADIILPHLLAILEKCNIQRSRVKVLIALGNHRKATESEIVKLVGEDLVAKLDIEQHNSGDPDSLADFGLTARGTKVKLNRRLLEYDFVITISAVTAHYFAGFGGGRKSIFPGVAGKEAIIRNHQLAIDFERGRLAEGVEPCRLQGNPLVEDLMEAVSMRPPDFAINSLLTPLQEIGAVFAGHWIESHEKACEAFRIHHCVGISGKRKLVIASCGGHPKDINLIQSHKTIQYASKALEDGGSLLLLARCRGGLGSIGFDSFFPINNVQQLLDKIKKENPANGQTALALHQKTREFRIVLVSSLPESLVKDMGMEPAASFPDAIKLLKKDGVLDHLGFIIPKGADTIPMAGE